MANATKKSSRSIAYRLLGLFLSASAAMGQAPQTEPAVKRVVGLEYPWFARMGGIQGTVELAATISQEGTVIGISVVSGPEPLATPAKDSLSKWRFTACTSPSAECKTKLVFLFVLAGTCKISHCPTEFEVDLPDKVRVKSKIFDSPIY